MTLPQLPKSSNYMIIDSFKPLEPFYTAAQMQEYAAAAVAAERERCATLCEQISERHLSGGRYVSVIADHSVRAGGQADGAEECATTIRADAPEMPR